jgi:hypothetical protein
LYRSCIEFDDKEEVHLTDEVSWTVGVAAPEMIEDGIFCKASDVFMATVIVAELLTATISDQVFERKILQRQDSGHVNFVTTSISKQYEAFFPLLKAGLNNEASSRPTAKAVLDYLLSMKKF